MIKIGMIGAGGWALALAVLLNNNGHEVTVWSKVEAEIEGIRKDGENKKSLPGIKIPSSIKLTTDLRECAEGKDFLVMAVASPFVRATSKELAALNIPNLKIVNVAKGIEDESLMTMTEIISDEIKDVSGKNDSLKCIAIKDKSYIC